MSETCAFPLCPRIAQRNGLCLNHRIYANEFPTAIIKEELKKPYKIPKVSVKRKPLNRELAKIVARIKKERPECEMKVPGVCTKVTTTVQHMKGRIGALLLNEKYMLASCHECNSWETEHPKESIEMGIKVSRLNKEASNS